MEWEEEGEGEKLDGGVRCGGKGETEGRVKGSEEEELPLAEGRGKKRLDMGGGEHWSRLFWFRK